jgi:FkbM family methyltransferase
MLRRLGKQMLTAFGLQRIPRDSPPPLTMELIASVLPRSPVIVEAGAHNGSETLGMSAAMPGCTIHAFEPVPAVFAKLTERTKDLQNVRRYPLALGERNTSSPMFVSSGGTDASSSLLRPKEHLNVSPHVRFESTIDVRTVTLADWARENNVSRVDFFWLDMQGNELAALRGAGDLLDTAAAIYTEVNLIELYEGAPLYHDVRTWIETRGFRVHTVDFRYPDSGDALFVRR